MENTLGKLIGKVKHALSITNDNDEKVSLSVTIDFTTATDAEIKSWLCSNRGIAGQRPWRKLSLEEIEALDGKTFVAQTIGQQIKTRKEQIQLQMNSGLSEEMAIIAVDNPEIWASILERAKDTIKEENTEVTETPTE